MGGEALERGRSGGFAPSGEECRQEQPCSGLELQAPPGIPMGRGGEHNAWWSRQECWQPERGGSWWDVTRRWAEGLGDAKVRRARQKVLERWG